MHEMQAFHSTGHGSSVLLSDGNCIATRCPASVSNAIVFSSRPLVVNQKIRLELTTTDDWSLAGNLRLGLTCVDPGGLTGDDLPEYAFPDLADRDSFWVKTVDKYLGDRVTRCVTLRYSSQGTLMFGLDKETKVVLLRDLPVDRDVWLLIDIYGRTTGVRIVQPDDVPREILALGPTSVRSYEAACEAGYQTVYRTRLVLFGRDPAGKNCVRSRLLGSSIGGKFGLSTSAIDLSASCSFSLSNHSKWKLATSSEEIYPPNATTDYDGNFNEDAESNKVAIATNIALKILHQRKSRMSQDDIRIRPVICKSPTQTNTQLNLSSTNNPGTECTTDLIENIEEPAVGSEANGKDEAELSYLKDLPRDVGVSLVQNILAEATRRLQESCRGMEGFCRPGNERLNRSWSQKECDVLFNVLDCSGDEAYYATNPVYLSSRAIYILVFDLSQDLEERSPVPSQNRMHDQQGAIGEGAMMSGLDYLDFCLRTIRAHASLAPAMSPCSSGAGSVDFPPVFIIGTNRDGLHHDRSQQQKLVEEKFDCIRRAIEGRPYACQVIRQYYAISCNSELESEIEQIDLLRCHIETIARSLPYMGEFIPTRWLNFEQAVDRLVAAGTNFCSVGQLRELALEEGITVSDEFETVVQFYHELGLLIHFRSTRAHCLSNSVIIIKPLWLVDVCKSILAADDHINHLIKPVDELAWRQYNLSGILCESLLGVLLDKSRDQRHVIIGCMEKLDLIVDRSLANNNKSALDKKSGRSFVVPFRFRSLPDKVLYQPRSQDVVFYYDFGGYLPDALFYRILAHAYRWSEGFGGSEPQLVRGSGRFYFDSEHDFVIALAPKRLTRIKIVILRVLDLGSADSDGSVEEDQTDAPPKPYVTAKVRNFLELTLCELREKWLKRLAYNAYVQCWCDRPCMTHCAVRCTDDRCLHFLSLDECLSNKVVYCDHRRCKTSVFRKGFPSSKHIVSQRPVLADRNLLIQGNGNSKAVEQLPIWVKSAAKLLNGGSDGLDWVALAQKFGYKRNKIETFNFDSNPALALITDWIISSGNTALSVDMMISFLEQMHRDDIVQVIQKGQEIAENATPLVFISYQWEVQDEVAVLRDVLERNGLTCWMDIGQMGGGDHLYSKIYEGIKNSKVLIACLTHKYIMSHYCSRELALADLLHKPIIPVLFEMVSWPPPGPMALIFSTLVYVNLKGVGGHGGSGIHADLDEKYEEIVTRVLNHASPRLTPFISLSSHSSSEDQSLNEYIPPSSARGQHRSTNFYTPYSLQSGLQSSRQPAPHAGIRVTYRSTGRDIGAHHEASAHVAKCVVCTLL